MNGARLVYSSDGSHRKICEKCGELKCICAKAEAIQFAKLNLKSRLEKASRGGKSVTVIFDLPANEKFCLEQLKFLRSLCSSGGTFKDGRIEIQGDHREKIQAHFAKLGIKSKLAGG